ncbi:Membrane-bound metal-dependent hydrolase YbcI, DUF457 family [Natrinema salifodinae]|uniref:Membrane-bound metal-dependent hydrolase YbcI, DUF457 family n=1 Tax=Natrinema salifodinae TaxID=1202768 RepID=A0A1I0MKX3_9EURY|nr:Membrane-bound metal-dependent hydrolase YbcI, DUF457 family [Natrinema salifodinae]
MYRDGHVGFNALLYAPFVPLVTARWSLALALWGAALAIVTATLPDVDQAIARIDHRGPTHTVWFACLVGLVAGAGTVLVAHSGQAFDVGASAGFGFGFAVGTGGILAHLAGDVVTPMGISPLAPVSRAHVTFDAFKSKNGRINRAVLLVGAVALLASLALTIGQPIGVAPAGGYPSVAPRHATSAIDAAQSRPVAVIPWTAIPGLQLVSNGNSHGIPFGESESIARCEPIARPAASAIDRLRSRFRSWNRPIA